MIDTNAPPAAALVYARLEAVNTGCPECGGLGWKSIPIGTPGRPRDGLLRCACNPVAIEQVAADENARAFGDEPKTKRRGNRRDWWGDR